MKLKFYNNFSEDTLLNSWFSKRYNGDLTTEEHLHLLNLLKQKIYLDDAFVKKLETKFHLLRFVYNQCFLQNNIYVFDDYTSNRVKFTDYFESILRDTIFDTARGIVNSHFSPFRNPDSKENFLSNTHSRLLNPLSYSDYKDIYKAFLTKKSTEKNSELYAVFSRLVQEEKINSHIFILLEKPHEEIVEIIKQSNVFKRDDLLHFLNTENYIQMMYENLYALVTLSTLIVGFHEIINDSQLIRLKLETGIEGCLVENTYVSFLKNEMNYSTNQIMTHTFDLKKTKTELFNTALLPQDNVNTTFKLSKLNPITSRLSGAKCIGEKDNTPIYSLYTQNWLQNFDKVYFVEEELSFLNQNSKSEVFSKINPIDINVEVSFLSDISFVNNYTAIKYEKFNDLVEVERSNGNNPEYNKIIEKAYENKTTINVQDLVLNSLEFNNNKIKALTLSNFLTGNQPFGFEFKSLTKNQLLTSNGSFVPVAFKTKRLIQSLNQDDIEEEIYYVSLVSFSNLSSVRKYKKAQKYLEKISSLVQFKNGLGLEKPELYDQYIQEKFKTIIKYFPNQRTYFEKFGESFISRFTNCGSNLTHLLPNDKLAILNGSIAVDPAIETKKQKLETQKKAIIDKFEETSSNLQKQIEMLGRSKSRFDYYTQQIQEMINAQKQVTFEIETTQKTIETERIKTTTQEKLKDNFLKEYNSFLNIYQENLNKAIEENKFVSDSFFENLNERGIFVSHLSFTDSTTLTYQDLTNLDTKLFSTKQISSVNLVISKPIAIKVDGNSENLVYGGPYSLRIFNDSMQIAPLNASTILAITDEDNNTYMIHPHASNSNLNTNTDLNSFYNFRRACLGESSPYIYKAFETNSLKMIIVNALVWLTSSNTADHWGKNSKYFPRITDLNEKQLNSHAIDINDYLIKQTEQLNVVNEINTNYYNDDEIVYEDQDDGYCDHEFDNEGECYHCGYYDEDYDATLTPEETTPEEQPQQTYTPYSAVVTTETTEEN